MNDQLDLFAGKTAKKLTEQDVENFVGFLHRVTDWRTARELTITLGHSDRVLRQLANASNGRVITGQRGYKAASRSTTDEIAHAAAWLKSQAQEMMRRAIAIENNAHRRIAA